MNRQQRRAEAHAQRTNRARKMGRAGVDRYIARARRWLIGVRFDGIPIQQEESGETIHGLTGTWRFPPSVPADRREATADYGEAGTFRWRLMAEAYFHDDQGGEYCHSVELETGQAQQLAELTDTWRDMLKQARDGGNPRHHHHDVIRAWPLVTPQARGAK